jgi:hypothetical protein
VAIPLISKSAQAALSDGDQLLGVKMPESDPELVALVRAAEDSAAEGGIIAAGRGRKGKRAEYRCAACGYGIIVYGQPPRCPMCREPRWEHVESRPFSQLLDFPLAPAASDVSSARLPSPTAEEPIRYFPAGQAAASLEK